VACLDRNRNHSPVAHAWKDLLSEGRDLVTSSYVLVETFALFKTASEWRRCARWTRICCHHWASSGSTGKTSGCSERPADRRAPAAQPRGLRQLVDAPTRGLTTALTLDSPSPSKGLGPAGLRLTTALISPPHLPGRVKGQDLKSSTPIRSAVGEAEASRIPFRRIHPLVSRRSLTRRGVARKTGQRRPVTAKLTHHGSPGPPEADRAQLPVPGFGTFRISPRLSDRRNLR
jgi:hypothetical protein